MTAINIAGMNLDDMLAREWLAVNHIGGYASSSLCGLNTRKYHGLLVASMSPPVRRMVLLSRVEEVIHAGEHSTPLSSTEYPSTIHPNGFQHLKAFSQTPFPRWAYQSGDWTIEKQLRLLDGENTVLLTYTLLHGASPVELEFRPMFAVRGIHELMYQSNVRLDAESHVGDTSQHRIRPTSRTPEVFFAHHGQFTSAPNWYLNNIYRREIERGYGGLEDVFTPGLVRFSLTAGQSVHFACSTEPIDLQSVIARSDRQFFDEQTRDAIADEDDDAVLDILTIATDQFATYNPAGSVSQFPWSVPSGRDSMIAFSGALLVTGRFDQAAALLKRFGGLLRNGLMPSEFPEDGSSPRYDGADVALWFINAVYQYRTYTSDTRTVRQDLLEVILKIVEAYRAGTDLGIHTDAEGLVVSHAPGIGTTWMNAKLGDWVVTSRAGRPVELNALWYNALRIAGELCKELGHASMSDEMNRRADTVKEAFNCRFWNPNTNCCFDVVHEHGGDGAVRPNQLLAISLAHPVLTMERFASVVDVATTKLLTPMGVRTLATDDPAYQGHYGGDVVSRDRAYHQGSAFPWLLGPYATALLRARGRNDPTRTLAMNCLLPCIRYMHGVGTGQLCELFSGDAPHSPAGAVASARSVAEVLRAYVEDVLGVQPRSSGTQSKLPDPRPPVQI